MSQSIHNDKDSFQTTGARSPRRASKALERKESNCVAQTRPMPLADRPLDISSSLEYQTRPMRISDRPSRLELSKVDDHSKISREAGQTSRIQNFLPKVLGSKENLPRRPSQLREVEPKQNIPQESRSNSVPKNDTQRATQRVERKPPVPGYQESRFDHSARQQPNPDRNSYGRAPPSLPNSFISKAAASKYRPDRAMNQYTIRHQNRPDRSATLIPAPRSQEQREYDDLSASSSHSNHPAYSQHRQQSQTQTRSQDYQDNSQSQSESSRLIQAKYPDKKDQKMAENQLKYDKLSPDQQQHQDAWATYQLNLTGVCPVGFVWLRDYGSLGYRCAGGGHFVSDQNLVLEPGRNGYGFGGSIGVVGAGSLRNWIFSPGITPYGYGIGAPRVGFFGYPVRGVAVGAPVGFM